MPRLSLLFLSLCFIAAVPGISHARECRRLSITETTTSAGTTYACTVECRDEPGGSTETENYPDGQCPPEIVQDWLDDMRAEATAKRKRRDAAVDAAIDIGFAIGGRLLQY